MGAGPAGLDELVGDPVRPHLLEPLREQGGPRGAELRPGRLGEAGQPVGLATGRVGVCAGAPGRRHLRPPVDLGGERCVGQERLGGVAPTGPRDVGGRDRDQVGSAPGLGHGQRHAGRTEEVHLDGAVDRGVEADRGGRVDDHIGRGEGGPAGVVQAEPVDADVCRDGAQPVGDDGVEVGAPLVPQAIEAVVPDDLAPEPVLCRGPAAGPHEDVDAAVRDRS